MNDVEACRVYPHPPQVNNVIDPFKYTEIPFSNKTELKDYLKVRRVPSPGRKK